MKTAIESAIKLLAERITADVKAPDALNFTQAALNLAHTAATIANANKHLEADRPFVARTPRSMPHTGT